MEITTTGKQASIIDVIQVDPFGLNNWYRVFEMKNIDNFPLDLMAGIHSTPARRYLSDKKIPEKKNKKNPTSEENSEILDEIDRLSEK